MLLIPRTVRGVSTEIEKDRPCYCVCQRGGTGAQARCCWTTFLIILDHGCWSPKHLEGHKFPSLVWAITLFLFCILMCHLPQAQPAPLAWPVGTNFSLSFSITKSMGNISSPPSLLCLQHQPMCNVGTEKCYNVYMNFFGCDFFYGSLLWSTMRFYNEGQEVNFIIIIKFISSAPSITTKK